MPGSAASHFTDKNTQPGNDGGPFVIWLVNIRGRTPTQGQGLAQDPVQNFLLIFSTLIALNPLV